MTDDRPYRVWEEAQAGRMAEDGWNPRTGTVLRRRRSRQLAGKVAFVGRPLLALARRWLADPLPRDVETP